MTSSANRHRSRSDDTLGNGIEAGIVLLIFAGIGALLDRWTGASPWLTIGFVVLGAVGLFYRLKADYSNRMDALAAERRNASLGWDADERSAT
jgi:F0F1-type ATP synthase assembly protein I